MNVPAGDLVRSRVVADAAVPLETALDRRLTGYLLLRPADPLAPDDDGGVLTLRDGVPTVAYHEDTDRGGATALGALASSGPYRAELYATDGADLDGVHGVEGLRVAPGAAAEQVADDPALAARARERAPDDRDGDPDDPVEAFLADEERIAGIRERAREEAERRAAEWGFADATE
ncbi:hypothetical protein [Halosegnis marinus]|uniref:DUF8054 domain-containing protein n=1 Tax=Halosegnis marinus TaxID=3034023 RepID=A0ABD5ZMG3_9EURY|nr:hypothetical protein [Halosegnis sp. DT85]